MRLFVRSKIYRAFPELDAFSDERCERFVRAAKRPFFFRVRRLAGAALAFVLVIVASYLLMSLLALVADRDPRGHGETSITVMIAGCLIAGFFGAGFAALRTRDWLLKRRLVHVLRTRGHCHSCGYLLAGVGVSPSNEVTCPECAYVSKVDPALGELVNDPSGRTHYQPSAASMRDGVAWLSPGRRALIRTWLRRALIMVPLGVFAWVAGYEITLRVEASQALRDRPGPGAMRALQLANLPPGVAPDAPNSWDAFAALRIEMIGLEAAATKTPRFDSQGRALSAEYGTIGEAAPRNYAANDLKDFVDRQRYAADVLDSMENTRFFAQLLEMVGRPRHMLKIDWDTAKPSLLWSFDELKQSRYLARLIGGRMVLAAQRGDLDRFKESLHINLGLGRMCRTQPVVISWVIGTAIDSLTWSRVRNVLMNSPGQAWLDVIEPAAWHEHDEPSSVTLAMQGEERMLLDNVCWVFEDPVRTRLNRFSPAVSGLVGSVSGIELTRLGFYRENVSFIRRITEGAVKAAGAPSWTRGPVPEYDDTHLVLPYALTLSNARTLAIEDSQRVELAGIITMCRIERYRLAHGSYPESLAQVQAECDRPLPPDPMSGEPLGYKRVDPATDRQHRSFILYSVGKDHTDNHGATTNTWYSPSNSPKGLDFIINDAEH